MAAAPQQQPPQAVAAATTECVPTSTSGDDGEPGDEMEEDLLEGVDRGGSGGQSGGSQIIYYNFNLQSKIKETYEIFVGF